MEILVFIILCAFSTFVNTQTQSSGNASIPSGCGWPAGIPLPTLWHKQAIPNPKIDVCKCGRKGESSWVCDPNGLITYEQANKIDEAIEQLRNSTGACHCGKKCSRSSYLGPDYRGYQMGVLLLESMYMKKANPSAKDRKKTADDFTDYLRDDKWEFGLCNDDMVILVSNTDRVVYTATGDDVSGIVTDSCVKTITANNKNLLSNKLYGDALLNMVEEYNLALQHEHSCNKPVSSTTLGIIAGCIVGAILSCIGCVCLRNKFCPQVCQSSSSSSSGGSKYHQGNKYHSSSPTHSRKSSQSSGGGGDTF